MSRNYKNWIQAYVDYTEFLESPDVYHIWTAISVIAGALGGKCWIDMGYFKWKPNFFVIFVAPPGLVSKSTTSEVGMSMLRGIENIHFGPASMTWQALTDALRDAEKLEPAVGKKVASLNIIASELGTFLDPRNRELVDVLTDMWDGKEVPWQRRTKGEGTSEVQNPWLNIIACTTPAWIQSNFPQDSLNGGFASRTCFVYADKKRKLVAYPKKQMDSFGDQFKMLRAKLVSDLKQIARITGSFYLTEDAEKWGEDWYAQHWALAPDMMDKEIYGGYLSRKQTHIHKIAMILSAAERDDRIIHDYDLENAKDLLLMVEPQLSKVFSAISDNREVHFLQTLVKSVPRSGRPKAEVWRQLSAVMTLEVFEACLQGAIKADFLREVPRNNIIYLQPHIVEQEKCTVVKMPFRSGGLVRASSATLPAVSNSDGSSPPESAASDSEPQS